MSENSNTVIVRSEKSVGLSLLLTFLFGGWGLMYVSVGLGIVLGLISLIAGVITFGISSIIIHPVCMIIGVIMTNSYNNKLMPNNTTKN